MVLLYLEMYSQFQFLLLDKKIFLIQCIIVNKVIILQFNITV